MLQHAGLGHDQVAQSCQTLLRSGTSTSLNGIAGIGEMIGRLALKGDHAAIGHHGVSSSDLRPARRLDRRNGKPRRRCRHIPGIGADRAAPSPREPRRTSATWRASWTLRRHELRHQRPLRRGAGIERGNAALGRLDGRDAVAMRRPAQQSRRCHCHARWCRCLAAIDAPAPPEEPPQVTSAFQGFRVRPRSGLSVKPRNENSRRVGQADDDGTGLPEIERSPASHPARCCP